MNIDSMTDELIGFRKRTRGKINIMERSVTNQLNSKHMTKDDRFKCVSLMGSIKRMKKIF